jgi:hypothetical protein
MERGGFEKKRVNPPIGTIKDRLIEGFGGKAKPRVSKAASDNMVSVCCIRLAFGFAVYPAGGGHEY